MSLLQVEGLSKVFGGVHAIKDLTFTLRAGTIHSVIGPNGAGKTTLFNLVTGLYTPSSGSIRLDGRDIAAIAPHKLARLGVTPDNRLKIVPVTPLWAEKGTVYIAPKSIAPGYRLVTTDLAGAVDGMSLRSAGAK